MENIFSTEKQPLQGRLYREEEGHRGEGQKRVKIKGHLRGLMDT